MSRLGSRAFGFKGGISSGSEFDRPLVLALPFGRRHSETSKRRHFPNRNKLTCFDSTYGICDDRSDPHRLYG